jgi:hypothetical protein
VARDHPTALLRVGRGSRVWYPFVGSGTTLVESSQLGADTLGTEVSPLACFVAAHQTLWAPPVDGLGAEAARGRKGPGRLAAGAG